MRKLLAFVPGVSGVFLDYKHVRYAGLLLWRLLFHIY